MRYVHLKIFFLLKFPFLKDFSGKVYPTHFKQDMHIFTDTCNIKLKFCSVICSISYFLGVHFQDDRYFLSGSLDGKLRLWNIPEKKVTMWNEVSSLITTANFCHNGKFAVAGTYDGKCIFYTTEVNLL